MFSFSGSKARQTLSSVVSDAHAQGSQRLIAADCETVQTHAHTYSCRGHDQQCNSREALTHLGGTRVEGGRAMGSCQTVAAKCMDFPQEVLPHPGTATCAVLSGLEWHRLTAPGPLAQAKLSGMVGKSSGYVETLPPHVRSRIEYLQTLQKQYDGLEGQYKAELEALRAKYRGLYGARPQPAVRAVC